MGIIGIDPQDAEKMHRALRTNGNWDEVLVPFDILDDLDVRNEAEVLAKRYLQALEKRDPDRLDRIREIVPGYEAPELHAVAGEILRYYGIDAIDLAILCNATARSLSLDMGDGATIGFWHSQGKPLATLSWSPSNDVLWEHDGEPSETDHSIQIYRDMPRTLVTAMAGEPLAALVSHPLLDQIDLRIAHGSITESQGFGNSTYFKIDKYQPNRRES